MLPMFTHPSQVSCCIDGSRSCSSYAFIRNFSIFSPFTSDSRPSGLDDFHIGLNDLHLDMGLDFMFELFASGLLDHAASDS